MKAKIALGADHGGFSLKQELLPWLENCGYEVFDMGAIELDNNDDYPDFAKLVGENVASGVSDKGLIVCGSGVGACIAANKVLGVRAGICHDVYSALVHLISPNLTMSAKVLWEISLHRRHGKRRSQ